MFSLKGYIFNEVIHESENRILYRGISQRDNRLITGMILKEEYPSCEELEKFEYGYRIIENLNIDGVVKIYEIEKFRYRKIIIMEDIRGISLEEYIRNNPIDIKTCLEIIISLTEILGNIHKCNIIHKRIMPKNILINPETKEIKILDFSCAVNVKKEMQLPINIVNINNDLKYISPEQTGRMNHSIDFRSDFYSLGIIFYEMITGQLPFDMNDSMELVHAHIARMPIFPHNLKEGIPEVISHIIMKLLSKISDDRYQSLYGLKADLDNCCMQLQRNGKIESFDIGEMDIHEKFQIPEKLYGREKEVNILFNEFTKVINGETRMILFGGDPGIGKTFLINEIHKPLIKQRGYFISGKFDQYKGGVPYSAVIQALQDLIKQILIEPQEILEEWKTKLLEALGTNAKVVVDVIPELELIIGKQPPVPNLEAVEAQNRFNLTFQNFIKVFAKKSHPIVVFIDDLQWADPATLSLVKVLMTDSDSKHMLFIGAYRDNEVDALHPFMTTMGEIAREKQTNVKFLTLQPLNLSSISQLISDTLVCSREDVKSLAELIKEKTEGNSFFVSQFLQTLYHERMLRFNFENLKWNWNIAEVKNMKACDNVLDLMVKRLRDLPKKTQEVLELAACMGNKFDLKTLSIIHEEGEKKTLEDLWQAIEEGYIVPLDENYKFLSVAKGTYAYSNSTFKFLHDKVQQAAYSLIPEEHRKSIHGKIGYLLLDNTKKEELEDSIFDIVNHLNKSMELIENEEKIQLAKLNLRAGKKAKISTAYVSALDYLTVGTEILGEESWEIDYNLLFELYKERAEAEYLNGNFEKSEELINMSLKKAKSVIEKTELYNLLIVQYTLRVKYDEAIEFGRTALKLLNIDLPQKDFEGTLENELQEINRKFTDRDISSFVDAPELCIPEKKFVIKLLANLGSTAYRYNHKLWKVIVVKMVNYCLEYGNIPESCYGYAAYGMIVGTVLGDYNLGYKFGILSLKLSERFNDKIQKSRTFFLNGVFTNSWVKHIKMSDAIIQDAYGLGMESGEFQFAGYALSYRILNLFFQGKKLEELNNHISRSLKFNNKTKNLWSIDVICGVLLIIKNLTDKMEVKNSFNSYEFNENKYLERCKERYNSSALGYYGILKSQVDYLYGNYQEALKSIVDGKKLIESIKYFILIAENNFYHSLSLTALYSEVSEEDQKGFLEQLQANQEHMKIWAFNCEENFMHKYLLIEAEIARISGKSSDAMDLYDRAIDEAKENEFIQNEALSNELAAKFFLARGRNTVASVYMKEAYYLYDLWGAKGKAEQLKEKYYNLISNKEKVIKNGSKYKMKNIDMSTVMKASQAISSEIVLENLIERLLKIGIENAGAVKGLFITNLEDKLVIQGEISDNYKFTMPNIPIEESDKVPHSVINYVLRVKENIVLEDAYNKGLFASDEYIVKNISKSIICMPIIHRGTLKGIIYFENNLTVGAFTENHLEVLKLLSSQIAISIENAFMYKQIQELNQSLEIKVEERTVALKAAVEKLKEEICERKQIEEDLQLNKERLHTIINAMPDIVALKDGEGRIIEVNQACMDSNGFNQGEIIGKTDLEIAEKNSHYKEYALNFTNTDEIAWNKGSMLRYEEKVIFNDGLARIIDTVKVPIFDSKRNRKGIVVVSRDITERKKAELALQESEERYRLLVDLLPDTVFIRNKDEFIFANKAGAKILGIKKPEDVIGKKISDLFYAHEEYEHELKKNQDRLLNNKDMPLTEEKLIRKIDGKVLNVETAATGFKYNEKDAVLIVSRDISERKRAEELRIKAEDKERLLDEAIEYDRLKTEFFANISHEFKTPLNVMLGALQMLNLILNNNSQDKDTDKIKKYSDMMKQNSYRLIRLVNNLIDITKIDAGYFNFKPQYHNIVSVVEEITLSVAEYIENQGVELIFDTTVEEKIVSCDPDKIERIVLNLLSNAVKFTEKGGNIFVNIIDKEESIIISVKDTGIGISKEKQDLIFKRFMQVDRSLSRNTEGSGIGLSIVKSLVEMHGGKISINSECGSGSEFIIEIPLTSDYEGDITLEERNMCSENNNIERISIEFSDIYF